MRVSGRDDPAGIAIGDIFRQCAGPGHDHRLVEEVSGSYQRRLAGLDVGQDDQPAVGEEVDRLLVLDQVVADLQARRQDAADQAPKLPGPATTARG